jgi:Family of unknown function (DUF6519)/IPT/TIG domain
MAGDRSRVSYDPGRKWRGLVAQQGRVTLDADWNEAATIGEERDRLMTLDAVGPFGTPDAGYGVTATGTAGPPAPVPKRPGELTIGPGTLYLGGERLDLDAPVTYSTQPDWLDYSTDKLWLPPKVPDAAGTSYELVYLLASEQEVSATEDPALADVALGGPDTMQRRRILQRFVRQPSPSGTCAGAWGALVGSLGAKGLEFDQASMMIGSTTTLKVTLSGPSEGSGPCQPTATGGFQGAENQMIRVMVASVDDAGVPTIVWGFDDASFLYRLTEATYDSVAKQATVTLASAPVDSFHHPRTGQAVELLRDAVKLTDTDYIAAPAGVVGQLSSDYEPARMQLVISGELDPDYLSAATSQLYLRVWQSTAKVQSGVAAKLGDTGVTVTLTSGTGTFHPGDFWRFALRPIEPATVYPARYLTEPQPPDGPRTFACPLAVLTWANGNATVLNCVPPFDDLVQLTARTGCCTVNVRPSRVAGGATLQALLNSYANRGRPITVCLEPGTYTLPAPLMLGPEFDGITLQGCGGGVVFEAPNAPADEFRNGLIAMAGARSVTIRGITLVIPLARFTPPSHTFDFLSVTNLKLLNAFSSGLRVAVGISVAGAAGLAIEDCTFDFPDPGGVNVFGAGIFATGTMQGVAVTGCTFQSANPPARVPFYALAAENKDDPPYLVTFGYLQVPPLVTGELMRAPGPAPADAPVDQLLDDATIGHCLFQGVTVPVLTTVRLGALRVDQNTVRNCYAGFWLVSRPFEPSRYTPFDDTATGVPGMFQSIARGGAAPLCDRLLVIATVIGRVLPASGLAAEFRVRPGAPRPGGAGTPLYLRLDMSGCEVEAVIAGSYSGASLFVDDYTNAGSVLVHGNRLRSSFPMGETALILDVSRSSVTGNIVANEAPALSAKSPASYSMRVAVPGRDVTAPPTVITGNVFLGPTDLPARPSTIPPDLADWDVLNTVIAYVPAPTVTGISPAGGSAGGGDSVTITGSGFTDPVTVRFGPSAATTINVDSDTQISAISPPGSGTVDVTVTTTAGTSAATAADRFSYGPAVTQVEPAIGPERGGTVVAITGSGFTGGTGVQFGAASAGATFESDTQISAISPVGSGIVDVTVTTPAGTSPATAADRFTYGPAITGLTPGIGLEGGGTNVTITGVGFTGATDVQFGRTSANNMKVDSDTQIRAVSPGGRGKVDVTVTTPAGTSAPSDASEFGYIPKLLGVPRAAAGDRAPADPERPAPAAEPEQAPPAKPRRAPRRRKETP